MERGEAWPEALPKRSTNRLLDSPTTYLLTTNCRAAPAVGRRVDEEWEDQGSSEVLQRDNDQIEWNRHAGNFHKICQFCEFKVAMISYLNSNKVNL